MKVRGVIFDLDGTLIDGYAAIGDALGYAVGRLGFASPSEEKVREMVGHGLERLLEKAVGPDLAEEGVRLFRERYPHVAVSKSDLLPGVAGLLAGLEQEGWRLAVASNKPAEFSIRILEAKGVAGHFRGVLGPDAAHPPKPDATIARELMRLLGTSAAETVCVGDMEVDVEFARAAGCRAIVAPTGSRSREFLEAAGADVVLDDLSALPEALRRLV